MRIARIVSFTVVLVALILGAAIIVAAYLQSRTHAAVTTTAAEPNVSSNCCYYFFPAAHPVTLREPHGYRALNVAVEQTAGTFQSQARGKIARIDWHGTFLDAC